MFFGLSSTVAAESRGKTIVTKVATKLVSPSLLPPWHHPNPPLVLICGVSSPIFWLASFAHHVGKPWGNRHPHLEASGGKLESVSSQQLNPRSRPLPRLLQPSTEPLAVGCCWLSWPCGRYIPGALDVNLVSRRRGAGGTDIRGIPALCYFRVAEFICY